MAAIARSSVNVYYKVDCILLETGTTGTHILRQPVPAVTQGVT